MTLEKMTSTASIHQLSWVQERLQGIQSAYKKALIDAPYLSEVVYDFTELTQLLFTITKKALQLSQLIHPEDSAALIESRLEDTENVLLEVEKAKDDILIQVEKLILYYNHLAALASQISGKPNPTLPFDTLRYMKTLRRYIQSEHKKTKKQLLELRRFTKAEYKLSARISLDSEQDDKKRYLDIQSIIARVVKCYIALAGHTQLVVKPIVKSAHDIIDLDACPTCNFVMTIFRILAPSLASYTLKNALDQQSHIMFLGCKNKMDSAILQQSIIYDALFEELRGLETLEMFWNRSVVKVHRNNVHRRFEEKMMGSLASVNVDDFWSILKLLVHSFPTSSELNNHKWESTSGNIKSLSGLILSIQGTGEGLGKARLQKPGFALSEDKEIENIRFDTIWSLVAHFSSFLTQVNILRKKSRQ